MVIKASSTLSLAVAVSASVSCTDNDEEEEKHSPKYRRAPTQRIGMRCRFIVQNEQQEKDDIFTNRMKHRTRGESTSASSLSSTKKLSEKLWKYILVSVKRLLFIRIRQQ